MFSQINIVPRWIIFILDLIICMLSLSVAYLIRFNFDLSSMNFIEFSRNIVIITLINSLVFFNVKTYSGIIRYTSAQDSIRILFAVLISNGIFFFVIGQVILYVFGDTICDNVQHYLDGLIFATICNLLAVMMVYKVSRPTKPQ
ncbi:MAG: hypothetical protein EOO89_30930 [Pedobacter sp.]|nr:MAG: hypothetical protein EOO89_30930 [Pedobacter sp.]